MKKTLLQLTILTLLLSFSPSPVLAESITIAPAREQTSLQPGQSTATIVKLYNHTDTPLSGTLKVTDFIVSDDQGTPEFLEDYSLSSDYAAATWIQLPYSRLTIPANDKVEFQVNIKAPLSALPGGHYAAIIFETSTDTSITNQSQAVTAPRLASLFYITIPGLYEESALVSYFKAPRFSQNGPVTITTKILNQSPTHIKPQGVITITNTFGDVVAHLNLGENNIFPQTERTYANVLTGKWLLGRYRADLYATYGTQGKTLQATTFFVVFPLALFIYIIIILTALYFIFKTLHHKNKHHQAHLEKEISRLKQELDQLEHQS